MISNPTQASDRWWDDVSFQDNLIALLVKDQKTLKSCGLLLSPEDFRPGKGVPLGRARWMVAERALEFYTKHHEPLGKLARADLLEYAEQLDLGASIKTELLDYVASVEKLAIKAPDAVAEKVVKFKSRVLKTTAIEELVDLQASNQLTDEKWAEVCQRVTAPFHSNNVTNYLETLSDRIDRRKSEMKRLKIPYTFIEPLDVLVRTVGPKQLGMVLAPYKRGKSMFLLWMAVAYARQRLNTLYITLEDPKDTVEDRMDSLVSHIPMKNLVSRPVTLRNRFERFRNMIHSQIRIYDGTEGGTSLQVIENAFLSYRDEGFIPDAIVIDYDEEIVPNRKYKEKRFETDEVYRNLRQLMAKYNLIGWVAAQTQRDTRHLKILSGDRVAEDIGKMRKVTCGISMGKGDWTDNSIYLWVAAHKNDKMECGCEIVPDLESATIYDEEATRRAARANAAADEP